MAKIKDWSLDHPGQVITASELLSKLNHLTLVGKNDEGQLEWIGTQKDWRAAEVEQKINEEL